RQPQSQPSRAVRLGLSGPGGCPRHRLSEVVPLRLEQPVPAESLLATAPDREEVQPVCNVYEVCGMCPPNGVQPVSVTEGIESKCPNRLEQAESRLAVVILGDRDQAGVHQVCDQIH